MDVREVNLDSRQTNGGDGVANGIAVVGVGARVDDQAIGPAGRLVNGINYVSLVVRLEGAYFDTLLSSVSLQSLVCLLYTSPSPRD